MERQDDVRGEAVHRLVDCVVENFPDEVMQAGGPYAADIHARPFADRLQPLENGDVFSRVVTHRCWQLPPSSVRFSARAAWMILRPSRVSAGSCASALP